MSLWKALFGARLGPPRQNTPLSRQQALDALHQCVQTRPRPEDVAELVPKPPKVPVPFRPTPELVHGVAIGSPGLATMLREAAWFSGKLVQPVERPVTVERDEHGFALRAGIDLGSDSEAQLAVPPSRTAPPHVATARRLLREARS